MSQVVLLMGDLSPQSICNDYLRLALTLHDLTHAL
jgi:hypothetical protein